MRYTTLMLLLMLGATLGSSTLHAQRYLDSVLTTIERSTHTYADIDGEDLQLDIYRSATDTVSDKPVLLYVHGGGFAGGQRDDPGIPAFAEYLAKRGYAVVSMSYRLTMRGQAAGFGCDQPTENKIATFLAAVADIRSATHYLLQQAEAWGIDANRIVLAGSSAGAEAVLHAAYWPEQHLPQGKTDLPQGFRYAGVISMAGALVDVRMVTAESAIPTLLFHGTCDNLVPYATDAHHYCAPGRAGYLILHGAKSIADRLHRLGQPYYLFTACGGRHEWASQPMRDYRQHFVDFLYHDVIEGEFRQVHEVIIQEGEGCDYFESGFPFCR